MSTKSYLLSMESKTSLSVSSGSYSKPTQGKMLDEVTTFSPTVLTVVPILGCLIVASAIFAWRALRNPSLIPNNNSNKAEPYNAALARFSMKKYKKARARDILSETELGYTHTDNVDNNLKIDVEAARKSFFLIV